MSDSSNPIDNTANDLFNPQDYTTYVFTVIFQNTTSHTKALPHEQVSLQEFDEQGIVLEVPRTSCNAKHSVALEIYREDSRGLEQPIMLKATGKVTEIEDTDDKAIIRARITMIQFDEEIWKIILQAHEDRQRAVEQFLANVRGY